MHAVSGRSSGDDGDRDREHGHGNLDRTHEPVRLVDLPNSRELELHIDLIVEALGLERDHQVAVRLGVLHDAKLSHAGREPVRDLLQER